MSDLAQRIQELQLRFLLISFTDLFGIQRAKLVPASAVAGMARDGAGFAGFALMLGCVLVIERELRAVGKVGLSDFATMLRTTRENAKQMRDKMGRDQ